MNTFDNIAINTQITDKSLFCAG